MHHMETLSTGVQSLWLFVYWYSLNREMNFATLRAPTSHGNLISLMATSVILLKQPSSLWWFLRQLGLVPISQNHWKIPFWSILRDRSHNKKQVFSMLSLRCETGCFTSKMTHFDTDRCIFVVPSLKLTVRTWITGVGRGVSFWEGLQPGGIPFKNELLRKTLWTMIFFVGRGKDPPLKRPIFRTEKHRVFKH